MGRWATFKLLIEEGIGEAESRGPLGVGCAVKLNHAHRQLGHLSASDRGWELARLNRGALLVRVVLSS